MSTRRLAAGFLGVGLASAAVGVGVSAFDPGDSRTALGLVSGACVLLAASATLSLRRVDSRVNSQMLDTLDAMSDVVYVSDPSTYEILWSNDAFLEHWDGEPIGRRCHDLVGGRDTPCPVCANEFIFGKNLGRTRTWEHRNEHLGRWYRSTDRAVRWTDGRWVRLSIATDLTESREALAALSRSKERFEIAARSAGHALFEWDPESGELFWDDRALDLFGFTREEFGGSYDDWKSVCHPDDLEATVELLRRAVETEEDFVTTFRIVRRNDGAVRWIDAFASILDDPANGSRRLVGVNHDVTARETLIRDLARSNEELEHFAYVASHDLQEPLRMVSSYTQLLADRYASQLDDKAKMYAAYATDGALRMQRLIKDLLAFSRVVRRAPDFTAVDLGVVCAKALEELGESIETSKAVVEVADDLPKVRGDALQLQQVVRNLLSNAIKFHAPGETPHVRVHATRDGEFHVLHVSDDGIGIDPRYQEKIFEIFERLHGPDVYPGTGIGLAIVLRVVERHGGAVTVDSTVGEGTTFHVRLPVHAGSSLERVEPR